MVVDSVPYKCDEMYDVNRHGYYVNMPYHQYYHQYHHQYHHQYNHPCITQAEDKQGMRALHVAASHNEHEIVAMLLEQNATIDCVDEEQSTPLHYAC